MKTSGRWDPTEAPIFFNAAAESSPFILINQYGPIDLIKHEMVALEMYPSGWSLEWKGDSLRPINVLDLPHVKNLMVDSGAFDIAKSHSDETGMLIEDVFGLSIYDVKGGRELVSKYIQFTKQVPHDRLWGIVELDFGTMKDREELRERVSKESGVVPIPVYHTASDPREYFKELLEKFDRVCIGGLSKLNSNFRTKLLAELAHLRDEVNTECWVHLLGHGLTYKATAFFSPNLRRGFQSFDSSQVCSSLMYGNIRAQGQNTSLGTIQSQFISSDSVTRQYDRGGPITSRGQRALACRLELAVGLMATESIMEWNK